mmetsp:Transcript_48568/g.93808  ORF Transcript_48568/g.93808 Transcript_48568/m.93808 type:complete len:307 (-) Transcript_48568:516-1436(-)
MEYSIKTVPKQKEDSQRLLDFYKKVCLRPSFASRVAFTGAVPPHSANLARACDVACRTSNSLSVKRCITRVRRRSSLEDEPKLPRTSTAAHLTRQLLSFNLSIINWATLGSATKQSWPSATTAATLTSASASFNPLRASTMPRFAPGGQNSGIADTAHALTRQSLWFKHRITAGVTILSVRLDWTTVFRRACLVSGSSSSSRRELKVSTNTSSPPSGHICPKAPIAANCTGFSSSVEHLVSASMAATSPFGHILIRLAIAASLTYMSVSPRRRTNASMAVWSPFWKTWLMPSTAACLTPGSKSSNR